MLRLTQASHRYVRGEEVVADAFSPGYHGVLAPEIALRASPASGAQALPLRPSADRTATRLVLGVPLLP